MRRKREPSFNKEGVQEYKKYLKAKKRRKDEEAAQEEIEQYDLNDIMEQLEIDIAAAEKAKDYQKVERLQNELQEKMDKWKPPSGVSSQQLLKEGAKEAKKEEKLHEYIREKGGEEWWPSFKNKMVNVNGKDPVALLESGKILKGEYNEPRVIITQDKHALYTVKDPKTGEWKVIKHADYEEGKKPKWYSGDGGMKIIGNYAKGVVKIALLGAVTYGLYSNWALVAGGLQTLSNINDHITKIIGFDLFGSLKNNFFGGVSPAIQPDVHSLESAVTAPPAVNPDGPRFPPVLTPVERFSQMTYEQKYNFMKDLKAQNNLYKEIGRHPEYTAFFNEQTHAYMTPREIEITSMQIQREKKGLKPWESFEEAEKELKKLKDLRDAEDREKMAIEEKRWASLTPEQQEAEQQEAERKTRQYIYDNDLSYEKGITQVLDVFDYGLDLLHGYGTLIPYIGPGLSAAALPVTGLIKTGNKLNKKLLSLRGIKA